MSDNIEFINEQSLDIKANPSITDYVRIVDVDDGNKSKLTPVSELPFMGTQQVDTISFDTNPTTDTLDIGEMRWNAQDLAPEYGTGNGNTETLGREIVKVCRNNTGSTITNGQVVYVSGSIGVAFPTIALADADLDTASKTIGVATEDIANGANGRVCEIGRVSDINTSAFSAGDTLYLSSTAGALTKTAPTKPARQIVIGTCLISHAVNGSITVGVHKTPKLGELSDVSAATPANGDVMRYNSSTSLWEKSSSLTVSPVSPAVMTVSIGTLSAGTVSDLAAFGGTLVDITEAATTGIQVVLDFTGVSFAKFLELYAYYAGSSSHYVEVEIWNYTTSAYVVLDKALEFRSALKYYALKLPTQGTYISGGESKVRLTHIGTGIATHHLYLDYVGLTN